MNIRTPKRAKRSFLPEAFRIEKWDAIKPYFDDLQNREIGNVVELKRWFKDRSELEAVLSEDMGWRYIKMTCDTTDEQLKKAFNYFVAEIDPKIAPYNDQLNKKALASPFLDQITEPGYAILIRNMKMAVEIFREENIPINAELSQKTPEFGAISGAQSIEWDGQELTLQQAAVKLQENNREVREKVYHQITARRLQDKEKLDDLFSVLIQLRHKIARNADFENYRDYMFAAMSRFDYTPEDCFNFHDAVEKNVVPILNELASERKNKLDFEDLRPWDKAVDVSGKTPLEPFNSSRDLIDKTIECFNQLDPFLGQCLSIMDQMGHLDLESRKGKSPGGYNYPLMEIGVPFIFMNATSTLRDLVTIVHEGGHAVHSFLTRDLELSDFKSTPSEVAELASMSMELISMDHWDLFFTNADDLKRAKKEHLEQIMETLPWVATIDKFQHWIYENPNHSVDDRKAAWNRIFNQFSDSITNWRGLEPNRDYLWQKQLHLFEVPFYYIEYGMAQLGAIAVWKNFKIDPQKGLDGYMAALKLGSLKTIPEVYAAANIKFDFSSAYIKELMDFVKGELKELG
ncbi:MAG: M3 family oligoendopeptidase [Bacteroidetes bacterium]|nr:M3 family oligoendopeptidase [Bacteroidota bacterium]MDA1121032.1 M3 family oligoendopeptidase [Bacteroidota bacterium]